MLHLKSIFACTSIFLTFFKSQLSHSSCSFKKDLAKSTSKHFWKVTIPFSYVLENELFEGNLASALSFAILHNVSHGLIGPLFIVLALTGPELGERKLALESSTTRTERSKHNGQKETAGWRIQ